MTEDDMADSGLTLVTRKEVWRSTRVRSTFMTCSRLEFSTSPLRSS